MKTKTIKRHIASLRSICETFDPDGSMSKPSYCVCGEKTNDVKYHFTVAELKQNSGLYKESDEFFHITPKPKKYPWKIYPVGTAICPGKIGSRSNLRNCNEILEPENIKDIDGQSIQVMWCPNCRKYYDVNMEQTKILNI